MSQSEAIWIALGKHPPWASDLVRELAADGWARLASQGISPAGYGTRRALEGSPKADRWSIASAPTLVPGARLEPTLIETFGSRLPERYREIGLTEAPVDAARIGHALEDAFRHLRLVPEAASVVSTLVSSIHIAAVDGPDYDMSYSDPDVPFSVFISIHPAAVANDGIRLAEGLLHEAMHLQLSLAERVVPLVSGEDEQMRSPWQGRPRPAQGLLHGLHVFRGIQAFFDAALTTGLLCTADRTHASGRVAAIEDEIATLTGLEENADLTVAGRRHAAALLAPGLADESEGHNIRT